VPGLLFHDLRRTAARNLIRATVSEHEAMQLTGHKTQPIFARYAIVDEGMLQDAGDRLAALHGQDGPERKVVPLAR
jgi:integrase